MPLELQSTKSPWTALQLGINAGKATIVMQARLVAPLGRVREEHVYAGEQVTLIVDESRGGGLLFASGYDCVEVTNIKVTRSSTNVHVSMEVPADSVTPSPRFEVSKATTIYP